MNLWSLICEDLYWEYILGLHPSYNVLVEQGAVLYLNPPPQNSEWQDGRKRLVYGILY